MPTVPKLLVIAGIALSLAGAAMIIAYWMGYTFTLGLGLDSVIWGAIATLGGIALVATGASLFSRLPPSQVGPPA